MTKHLEILKRILGRIIDLFSNKKRYKTSERQRRRTSEANKGRIPWNKGKVGMGIYSEEALAKMLKGTLKRHAKGRLRRKFKKAIKQGTKKFKKLITKITRPIIRVYRRYERYKQKRERIKERKRKLIERRKWFRQKYLEEKLSMIQIAELNNVTRQAISKELKKYGIVGRSIKEAWKECKARREKASI